MPTPNIDEDADYEGITEADESREYEPVMAAELEELTAAVKVLTRREAERTAEEERTAYNALSPMGQAIEDLAEAGFNDQQQHALARFVDAVSGEAKEHAEKAAVISGVSSTIASTLLGALLHRRPKSLQRRVLNYALEGAWSLLHD